MEVDAIAQRGDLEEVCLEVLPQGQAGATYFFEPCSASGAARSHMPRQCAFVARAQRMVKSKCVKSKEERRPAEVALQKKNMARA